jgi:hypothetical protein
MGCAQSSTILLKELFSLSSLEFLKSCAKIFPMCITNFTVSKENMGSHYYCYTDGVAYPNFNVM